MTYTLYTYPGNPRAFKILIAAQYNNVKINISKDFQMGKDNKTNEFLKKNPLGKVPVLDTPDGSLFESTAIARYIARLRNDTKLYGKSFYESGQVDEWIDYCTHELDVPVSMWLMPVLGYMPYNAESSNKAKQDVKQALSILEKHLLTRTYIVGEQITLADIVIFSSLLYPFKILFDKDYRKQFVNVQRWFVTLANQDEFAAVVGDVPLCQIANVAEGCNQKNSAKNEKKEKSKKKEQTKPKKEEKKQVDEEMEEKPKKKPEHPLSILNREKPSSMVLDAWKVQYSNTKPLSKAMEWFWENLDQEGYSLWFCNYNYNAENTKVFMTCNAVSGFLQRSEAMRKYAFGVMDVIGEEGKEIEITGCWLFRGDSEKHMIEANPDAEYYTWTKITKLDDKAKKEITAYWINEDELHGMPILDSKVFK